MLRMVCYVLGLAIAGATLAWGCLGLETLLTFCHGWSALFVMGVTIGVVIMTWDPGALGREAGRDACLVAARAAIGAGALGTLIGLVVLLKNLDDPSMIGPSIAAALFSLLYGIGLSEVVLRPAAHILAGKIR